jgi:hypothetical protein
VTVRRLAALMLVFAATGCTHRAVPVPELDDLALAESTITATSRPDDVRATLGPPVFTDDEPTLTRWWYPIRVPAGRAFRAIRAAALVVSFDPGGRVIDWRFAHPITGTALPIRESRADAEAWLTDRCRPLPVIDLPAVLRRGTPRAQVLERLRWYPPRSSPFLDLVFVRSAVVDGRETLTFYADRPSPLYVPPFYLEVRFPRIAGIGTVTGVQGAGASCK